MLTDSSLMAAATTPARWGVEVVDVVFGEVRTRRSQAVVLRGDLVRTSAGKVYQFYGRKGGQLHLLAGSKDVWVSPC